MLGAMKSNMKNIVLVSLFIELVRIVEAGLTHFLSSYNSNVLPSATNIR